VHRQDIILNVGIAVGFFILSIIASPPFEEWWEEDYGKTPERLSKLLQATDIEKFNDEGKKFMKRSSLMQ